VARELFRVSEEWLASKGMSLMRGPINGRVDIGCGFLLEGFDSPPSILSSYSPKYYLEFAERYGMKKCRDLIVFNIDLTKPIPKVKRNIKVRGFNRILVGREIKLWSKLFMQTFSEHWGFVPVSYKEVKERFGIKQARWFVDPKLFLIAEIDKKPVAFICASPDYNQIFKKLNGRFVFKGIIILLLNKGKVTRGKLNLIGCLKEYRNQDIASYLNYCVIREMKKRGYKSAEVGWVDEENRASIRIIEKMGGEAYKRFRVFEKKVKE
jgi:RimJ/RimL family protein N-acetyltransferase